jgi:hypothetical protein
MDACPLVSENNKQELKEWREVHHLQQGRSALEMILQAVPPQRKQGAFTGEIHTVSHRKDLSHADKAHS